MAIHTNLCIVMVTPRSGIPLESLDTMNECKPVTMYMGCSALVFVNSKVSKVRLLYSINMAITFATLNISSAYVTLQDATELDGVLKDFINTNKLAS